MRSSYYRLGVGGRTGQATTASRSTPWLSRGRSPPALPETENSRNRPHQSSPISSARAGAPPRGCAPCTRPPQVGLSSTGWTGPHEQVAALISRTDRRGRMLWSLPKGHIEQGETAEQTAIREVAEETGIHGHVLAALGSIDYWFVTEGRGCTRPSTII